MVIDISGSMTESINEKMIRVDAIKKAASSVVDTLTSFDWIGFIAFNTEVQYYNDTLVKATDENKIKIKKYIQRLVAVGKTNYENAFSATFDLIRNSNEKEQGTSCQTIVQFLTDGQVTSGKDGDELIAYLEQQKESLQDQEILVFTYAVGKFEDQAKELLNNIACTFKGIFTSLSDNDDINTSMASYYRFIAATLTFDNPAWVGPYEDSLGAGTLISVTYPVYLRTQEPPIFIGVVSVDIMMDKFYEIEGNKGVVLDTLKQRSVKCVKNNLTECQIQKLRGSNVCPNVNLSECNNLQTNPEVCTTKLDYTEAFCGEGHQILDHVEFNNCCGENHCKAISNLELIFIIAGSVIAVAVIFVLF
eukprot:TRINITY_DN3148_c0_g1_i1.p1 TRINITY_DN3148_c0_g1~~TRINITY_DN3148_c0_g1_i1.p1  ORF type:complete len:362 (+),score=52.52 TRINITY_DN3148_c0_g1_i1:462-1547(+)